MTAASSTNKTTRRSGADIINAFVIASVLVNAKNPGIDAIGCPLKISIKIAVNAGGSHLNDCLIAIQAVHSHPPRGVLTKLNSRCSQRIGGGTSVVATGFGGGFPIADYLRNAANALQD